MKPKKLYKGVRGGAKMGFMGSCYIFFSINSTLMR